MDEYGTDILRLLVMSVAAPRSHWNWDLTGKKFIMAVIFTIFLLFLAEKGLRRWLDRIKFVVNTYIRERKSNSSTDQSITTSKEFLENEKNLKYEFNRVSRRVRAVFIFLFFLVLKFTNFLIVCQILLHVVFFSSSSISASAKRVCSTRQFRP